MEAQDRSGDAGTQRYAREITLAGDDSLSRIARRIAGGAAVLDVGTGPGALGRYLAARGCVVDGVEGDEAQAALAESHYRRLHRVDVERGDLGAALGAERYDVVVCADVLEHLRDPGRALDALRPFLRPGGRLIVSVPNVGYAGLLAGILDGEFRYRPVGLLDETHLRFFTRKSLLQLLAAHGLGALDLETVTRPLHESEFRDHVVDRLPPALARALLSHEDAATYQFIVETVPGVPAAPHLRARNEARVTFGVRLYWRCEGEAYATERSAGAIGEVGVAAQALRLELPRDGAPIAELRLDPADRPGFLRVHRVAAEAPDGSTAWEWAGDALRLDGSRSYQLVEFGTAGHRWWLSTGDDPGLVLPIPAERIECARGGRVVVELGWPLSPDSFAIERVVEAHVRAQEERTEQLATRQAEQAALIAELRREVAAADARAQDTAERLEALSVGAGRRAAMASRRLVSPRRFALAPVPERDVSFVAGPGRWRSTGFAPRIRLERGTNRHPCGWVEVDLELEADDGGAPLAPALIAFAGAATDAGVRVALPPVVGGRSRGVVKLPDRVRALQLDPADRPTGFRLGKVQVRELSTVAAGARLVAPLVPAWAREPRAAVETLSGAWRAWRGAGWPALKRHLRETLPEATRAAARPRGEAATGPRAALLAVRLLRGFGVEVVLAAQVEYLCAQGWDVTVIVHHKDEHYEGLLRRHVDAGRLRIVVVDGPEAAAVEIVRRGVQIAVAHTPPFYETLAALPDSIVRVLFDHGEPPPELFANPEERRAIAARKVEVAHKVDLAVAISEFVRADSALGAQAVCPNGNDHLLRRRSNLGALGGLFRAEHGLGDAFVVLNVTRYLGVDRVYKGVQAYAEVQDALRRIRPDLRGRVRFVLAGRSEPEDRAWAEGLGLVAASNLDEDALLSAYLDSDLYLTTSRWEGCNLGLAQALALGVPALASARGAHAELGVATSDDPEALARLVAEAVDRRDGDVAAGRPRAPLRRLRDATVVPWRESARRAEALVLAAARSRGFALPATAAVAGPATPELSVLVLNKDRPDLLLPCVRSIEAQCDVPFELLVGDTGSTHPEILRWYDSTRHPVHTLGHYQFSRCNNVLASRARGRWLLFLNNDTKLVRGGFRAALDYLAGAPDVGCAGSVLLYADDRIQHGGVRICRQPAYRGIPEHVDRLRPYPAHGRLHAPRDVVGVTGAMLLVSAARFAEVGGFDEVFEEEAQDIDLCLKLRARGLRSVVHPALLAYHYENSTRTVKESPRDRDEFLRRWQRLIDDELFAWQAAAGLDG